jgi:hypothetical protein
MDITKNESTKKEPMFAQGKLYKRYFLGNGRPNERWTKINRNEDEANNLTTKSIMITDYKDDSGVGMPVTKAESHEGRKQLSNGMYRVHRVLTDDEVNQGKGTRWTELEIHGRYPLVLTPDGPSVLKMVLGQLDA